VQLWCNCGATWVNESRGATVVQLWCNMGE